MIIARAPYRVSFFGGGTDYPGWFSQHGGAVLTSTIDKYCYLSVRRMPRFLGNRYRVAWSKTENVDRIEDIEHAGARGCLQALGITDGVDIVHAGDLPARSGLGSSSAFTVALLHALHALAGENVGPAQLAREAIHVEQDVLRETVGVQDQIESAWGGLNVIEISKGGNYSVSPVEISSDALTRLESRLLLFFTGLQRHASEIAAAQVANADRKYDELMRLAALVPDAVACLAKDDLAGFGRLLHETWVLKSTLSDKISNSRIDEIYAQARSAGALGGKVLGAGGGGFMLLYAPLRVQEAIRAALKDLIEVPFHFGAEGSRLVLNEP